MELPIGKTNSREFWMAHIEAAERFSGTNKEYCRRQGLNPGSFNSYRNKLGFTKARNKKKASGFSKVQVVSQASPVSKRGSLPDPKWLADFLKAWGA